MCPLLWLPRNVSGFFFFLFRDLQLPDRTLKVEINNIGHVGKVGLKRFFLGGGMDSSNQIYERSKKQKQKPDSVWQVEERSVFPSGMELDVHLFIKCIASRVHTCQSRKKCWFESHVVCIILPCYSFDFPNQMQSHRVRTKK